MIKSLSPFQWVLFASFCLLGACSSPQPIKTVKLEKPTSQPTNSPSKPVAVTHTEWEEAPQGAGYYLDDGPGEFRPVDLQNIPNAEPFIEPLARFNLREYTVMGQTFIPQTSLEEPYKQRGKASWYGRKFHGSKTANGEIYDMYQMTAAHPTLPLPSYAKVTNVSNGKSVIVRVNDRGPFLRSRIMDLSYAAAFKLGYINMGSAEVVVEKLTPELIALYKKDPPGFMASESTALASAIPSGSTPMAIPVALKSADQEDRAGGLLASRTLYLQVGAFGALPNAENMREQVKAMDPSLNDVTRILQQEGLYRVFVGPFTNRDQANEAAIRLASKGDVRPVVREGLILP